MRLQKEEERVSSPERFEKKKNTLETGTALHGVRSLDAGLMPNERRARATIGEWGLTFLLFLLLEDTASLNFMVPLEFLSSRQR